VATNLVTDDAVANIQSGARVDGKNSESNDAAINAALARGDIEAATSAAQSHQLIPTLHCFNILINAHARKGGYRVAGELRSLLHDIGHIPNIDTYNALLLSAAASNAHTPLKSSLNDTNNNNNNGLSSSSSLSLASSATTPTPTPTSESLGAEALLSEIRAAGLTPNVDTYNAFITASRGNMVSLRSTLKEMSQTPSCSPNLTTYKKLFQLMRMLTPPHPRLARICHRHNKSSVACCIKHITLACASLPTLQMCLSICVCVFVCNR
jgi:hypothetical protein